AKSGDINSHGAQILAGRDKYGRPTTGSGDIALTAGNTINLNSAVASGNTSSKGTSLGAGVGLGADVTVGANGVSIGEAGLSVTANGSKSSATQDTVTNINTHVAGLGEVTLKSGSDTNLKGAVVAGDTVRVNAGGDLNIESQVDTATARASKVSANGSVGTGGFNVSGAVQNAKGDAAVVSEQSGIRAGEGGFDIKVDGNTKLKGGLITSDAPATENRLETGTLKFEDIDTHSKWKAKTFGGSVGSGGISVAPPISEGHSETGKALSAVSPAGIVITDPSRQTQNIDDLRRDTTATNTSLPGLPDLQNILREQYKTQARYQEAAKMMAEFVAQQSNKLAEDALKRGDLKAAEFWGPHGMGRAALHALGGGILGGVNDVSGMIRGAFGGAASTLIAAHVKALVDDMIDKAGLGGTEAGRSLANIVSGGIVAGLTSAVGGGDAAAYATHEFRYNYLTSQQLDKAIDTRKKIAQCQQTLRCERAEIDRLISLDREYVERSASNTRTLIETCQKTPQGAACQQGMKDAMSYGKRLEHEYQSGGASWEGAAGFSNKNSIYDYDLLLYRSLLEAQATGKQPDAAIRDFLTDFAKQEGRVGSLLDALGVVGGAAVCASGAGTPACVAGILAAISSANHLSADAQKAVTGQEARTVLVAALVDRLDYTKEQAEKLQFYIDIGVIAVTVGAGGYKIAVDAKRLEKADQALVKLSSNAPKRGAGGTANAASGAKLNKELLLDEVVDHSFYKHVLQQGEFKGLGIRTKTQFREHVNNVIENPSSIRYYSNGRSVYLQESTGTVVVRNPTGSGQSTAFQPKDWNTYVSGLPKQTTPPQ
ncbi:hypothetical protein CQ054_10540, partial [Ochrobactrum sp. MYb29]